MAFNLSTLSLKETSIVHLTHPETGEKLYDNGDLKLPVQIEVYGTASKAYRNKLREIQNERMKINAKPGKAKTISVEKVEENSIDLLVAASIRGINIDYQGKPLEGETFRELYNDISLDWVKTQVSDAVEDVKAFLV